MRKSDLLNKGYHLFTDNYYTKPALAEVLCGDGTLLTGTVRANSRGLPVLPTKLQVGQCLNFRHKDTLVVAFREKGPPCASDQAAGRTVPELPPQGHAGRRIQGEEISEETCALAEHERGGWHGRRPNCSWATETQAQMRG